VSREKKEKKFALTLDFFLFVCYTFTVTVESSFRVVQRGPFFPTARAEKIQRRALSRVA
jgi:hypothetical protein